MQNNGQSCIAAKRFIVHSDVYDAFEDGFVSTTDGLVVGDPMEPATGVGPLALEQRPGRGARPGGGRQGQGGVDPVRGAVVEGPGYFYRPTVVSGITPSMRVATEEVFGPVALLYRVRDSAEALRLANDTAFGLGASVWTQDPGEQRQLIEGLDVGMVFVNAMVASTPELPFGGTKHSGYGRELAALGMREFCEARSVWVA